MGPLGSDWNKGLDPHEWDPYSGVVLDIAPSDMGEHTQETAIYESGSGSTPDTESARALIFYLLVCKTEKSVFVV